MLRTNMVTQIKHTQKNLNQNPCSAYALAFVVDVILRLLGVSHFIITSASIIDLPSSVS